MGGDLNISNLNSHNHIWIRLPVTVADYKVFDGTNPSNPIKLCGVLLYPLDCDSSEHWILSAVIHYRAPFSTTGERNIFFYFALVADMAVDFIIEIPFINEFSMELWFKTTEQFIAHNIQAHFPVVYRKTLLSTVDQHMTIVGNNIHSDNDKNILQRVRGWMLKTLSVYPLDQIQGKWSTLSHHFYIQSFLKVAASQLNYD